MGRRAERPGGAANGVRDAYGAAPAAWSTGAELVYGPLAGALVGACPQRLDGRVVVDVGAGTGAATPALLAAGGRPVSVDVTVAMLAYDRDRRPPAAAGDVLALPFRNRAFGAAVAAFVLNHVDRPVQGLRELARVVVARGPVLAAVFSNADRPPLKDAIDAVVASFGWEPPAWYLDVKERAVPLLGSAEAMAAAAVEAGLADVRAREVVINAGLSPADVVGYRLSLAHLAPFVAALDPDDRAALCSQAVALAEASPEPYAPRIVVLTAQSR